MHIEHLKVEDPWEISEIYRLFRKIKPSMHITDSVFGPFTSRRQTRVYKEHFREFSFSPDILRNKNRSKIDYLQKRHLSMIETGFMEEDILNGINEIKSIPLEDSSENIL